MESSPLQLFLALFFSQHLLIIDELSKVQQELTIPLLQSNDTFDYIIVGGGTAGSVLANRLSADPNSRVLLIESGGDPNPLTTIPILTSQNVACGSQTVTQFQRSVVQPRACLATGGVCTFSSGKNLGGATNINSAIYTRGSPQVFDEWGNLAGDKVWNYSNFLNIFKKSEDYHGGFKTDSDANFHSIGGELFVGNPNSNKPNPAFNMFLEAAKILGYQPADINNGLDARSGGVGEFDFNVKNGRRWGTYKAFLEPVLGRSNLIVARYTEATKIHFAKSLKAIGVSYMRNGTKGIAGARKEVILSAGTFGSAKLLMLSGIGPKNYLESLQIKSLVDLPVGESLSDHAVMPLTFSMDGGLFFYPERDATLKDAYTYFTKGTGPLGKSFAVRAYILTTSSVGDSSWPDVELLFGSINGRPLPSSSSKVDYFSLVVFNLNPKSVGTVKLSGSHFNDPLLIDPQYNVHPDDMEVLLEGAEKAYALIQDSPSFQNRSVKYEAVKFCENFATGSRGYWKCVAAGIGGSGSHFVGTCRMGRKNDAKTVVTSTLQVLGTSGLRVIDASVMPVIPNSHTGASVVAVAELGAHFILSN